MQFSPTLAATIGLREAVLYQLLVEHSAFLGQGEWSVCDIERLIAIAPFWGRSDLFELLSALQDADLIRVGSNLNGSVQNFRYLILGASNDENTHKSKPTVVASTREAPPPTAHYGPTHISVSWRPTQEAIDYLQSVMGIPAAFIEDHIGIFVTHNRESGEQKASWNSAFIRYVSSRWQREKVRPTEQPRTIPRDWEPSAEAISVIEGEDIPKEFAMDAVPEFILYWRENGKQSNQWNTLFLRHVRRQWAFCRENVRADAVPSPICDDWIPDETVWEILAMGGIPKSFGSELIAEFRLYWKDAGVAQPSWNAKFIQHAKACWARKDNVRAGQGSEARELMMRATDRSWADHLLPKTPATEERLGQGH